MCKTYDAIYELSNHVESNILICVLNHFKVEGELHSCGDIFGQKECYEGIITLKDAKVHCPKTNTTKEFKWFNISSKHIEAFAFKCCEM